MCVSPGSTSWSRKAGASPTPSARSASPRWLRDELLDGEIFYSLREAEVVIESWRRHYNTVRPHASLGFCCVERRPLSSTLAISRKKGCKSRT